MKNYVQKGDTVTVTAPTDVASGDGVLVGALFGIATASAVAGAEVEIQTVGVHNLPKVSAQPWTQGAPVYGDNAARNVTTTVGTNTKIGVATLATANPSTIGTVRLNGAF